MEQARSYFHYVVSFRGTASNQSQNFSFSAVKELFCSALSIHKSSKIH